LAEVGHLLAIDTMFLHRGSFDERLLTWDLNTNLTSYIWGNGDISKSSF
jgi:hypothetical protein